MCRRFACLCRLRCGSRFMRELGTEMDSSSRSLRRFVQITVVILAVLVFMGAGDNSGRFEKLGHSMMCACGCGQILLECNHVGCQYSDKMRNELMAALTRGGGGGGDSGTGAGAESDD